MTENYERNKEIYEWYKEDINRITEMWSEYAINYLAKTFGVEDE